MKLFNLYTTPVIKAGHPGLFFVILCLFCGVFTFGMGAGVGFDLFYYFLYKPF